MSQRHYSPLDRALMQFHRGFETLFNDSTHARRPYPGAPLPADRMDTQERRQSGRLMRVNHAGEISAKALYHGQALTDRDREVRRNMARSAQEEEDHLAWCQHRLNELGGHTSRLGPFWYAGSFGIGAAAGLVGDRVSLGFVAETERQVVEHLGRHLDRLPPTDMRSRAVIRQMQTDEQQHGEAAARAGGVELPGPVRRGMELVSRMMTGAAYWF